MKSAPVLFVGLLAVSTAAATSAHAQAKDATPTAAKVARGEYLVESIGCMDCHTPFKVGAKGPEPDKERHLSGHPEGLKMPPPPSLPEGPWLVISSATNTAWAGPWGVSFTANLTPDNETGLGDWTERDFVQTMRTGRRMGKGRDILPPMPIPAFSNFTDEDLGAMFAYLRTLPPVKNKVPEPVPPKK
jgi:mono/diheme cytochrome c family protein